MKLPRIDRGGKAEFLGRNDITAPVRVAEARNDAATAKKEAVVTKLRGSNEYYQGLTRANNIAGASVDRANARDNSRKMNDIRYKSTVTNNWLNFASSAVSFGSYMQKSAQQKAVAEGADYLSDYKQQEADLRKGLTRDPFRIENGKVVSNADTIADAYFEGLNDIKQGILGIVDDPRVNEYLSKKFNSLSIGTSTSISDTSYNWTMNNNQIIFDKAMSETLEAGDVEGATQLLNAGADNGLISAKDIPKIQNAIESTNAMNIFSAQSERISSVTDIVAMRDSLKNKEIYGSLNKEQMSVLSSNLDSRLDDYWIGSIKNVANSKGITAAKAELRRLSSSSASSMGYVDNKSQSSVVGNMKTAINNISFGLKDQMSSTKGSVNANRIMSGMPISQSVTQDKKDYNSAFNYILGGSEDPTPFSQDWVKAVGAVSTNQVFFPSQVKDEISRYSSSTDPKLVAQAADFYRAAKKYNPLAVSNMKLTEKERLFLDRVDNVIGPTEETIKEIRDGIFKLDQSIISDRSTQFKADYKPEIDSLFEAQIDEDGKADPWFSAAATYGSPVKKKFNDLVQHKFLLSGDIDSASSEAYSELRNSYPLSNRSGSLEIVGPDQPESMYGDKYGMDWYGEEVDSVLEKAGYGESEPAITSEDVQLFEAGKDSNGNRVWMMYDNGKFLLDKNNNEILVGFNYADSEVGKKQIEATKTEEKNRRMRVERDKQYKRETKMPPPGGEAWGRQEENLPWQDFMENDPKEEREMNSIRSLLEDADNAMEILQDNKSKKFVKGILNNKEDQNVIVSNSPEGWIVFPSGEFDSDQNAQDYSIYMNDYIKFGTKKEAVWFANNYQKVWDADY